jgi:hypothetical protein
MKLWASTDSRARGPEVPLKPPVYGSRYAAAAHSSSAAAIEYPRVTSEIWGIMNASAVLPWSRRGRGLKNQR